MDSHRVYNKLVRLLSALTYWNPLFGEVEFLPKLALPFVRLVQSDDLFAFELVLSLVVHWMQTWFESYPGEPAILMHEIDSII